MAKIEQKTMDAIAAYMDDDKREQVHFIFIQNREFFCAILMKLRILGTTSEQHADQQTNQQAERCPKTL